MRKRGREGDVRRNRWTIDKLEKNDERQKGRINR